MKAFQSILVCVACLLAVPMALWSQDRPMIVFNAGEDGVYLRWDLLPEATSYTVYAIAPNGDRTSIGTAQPEFSNARIRAKLGGRADVFLGLLGATNPGQDLSPQLIRNATSDPEQRKLVSALSLVNPEFGPLLGVVYHWEANQVRQNTVGFQVDAQTATGPLAWARTEVGLSQQAQRIPEVTEISGEGGDRSAVITWKKDLEALRVGQIVTWRVYRSSSELGPFTRVSGFGILPGKASQEQQVGEDIQQHADFGLENGSAYFYYITAVNAFGRESRPSTTLEIIPGNYDPPAPPSDIRANQAGQAVQLQWSHADDQLKGFEISRSTDPDKDYSVIYPASRDLLSDRREFIDVTIEPGEVYYYRIRSVNARDIAGPWSQPVTFVHRDRIAPARITEVFAIADDEGRVTIYWNRAPEADVTGYDIERATDNRFDWLLQLNMQMIEDTFYVDQRPVESASTYGYVVYANDRSHNRSPASPMVKVRLPDVVPPQAPVFTALEDMGDTIDLAWTRSIEEDVSHYLVYRTSGADAAFQQIGRSTSPAYRDVLPSDGVFRYAVSAVDRDGNESARSNSLALTKKPSPYPDRPVLGSVEISEGKVTIRWSSPDDPRVEGYLISRYAGGSDVRRDVAQRTTRDSLEFTDWYVVSGRSYVYEVRSRDAAWQLSVPLRFTVVAE